MINVKREKEIRRVYEQVKQDFNSKGFDINNCKYNINCVKYNDLVLMDCITKFHGSPQAHVNIGVINLYKKELKRIKEIYIGDITLNSEIITSYLYDRIDDADFRDVMIHTLGHLIQLNENHALDRESYNAYFRADEEITQKIRDFGKEYDSIREEEIKNAAKNLGISCEELVGELEKGKSFLEISLMYGSMYSPKININASKSVAVQLLEDYAGILGLLVLSGLEDKIKYDGYEKINEVMDDLIKLYVKKRNAAEKITCAQLVHEGFATFCEYFIGGKEIKIDKRPSVYGLSYKLYREVFDKGGIEKVKELAFESKDDIDFINRAMKIDGFDKKILELAENYVKNAKREQNYVKYIKHEGDIVYLKIDLNGLQDEEMILISKLWKNPEEPKLLVLRDFEISDLTIYGVVGVKTTKISHQHLFDAERNMKGIANAEKKFIANGENYPIEEIEEWLKDEK